MSSACEVTSIEGFSSILNKSIVWLREQSLLCDVRDEPVLYRVGEKVTDIKDKVVVIEKFGIIRCKGGNTRGAVCRSNGGWRRFLPLLQLEKYNEEDEDEEAGGICDDADLRFE